MNFFFGRKDPRARAVSRSACAWVIALGRLHVPFLLGLRNKLVDLTERQVRLTGRSRLGDLQLNVLLLQPARYAGVSGFPNESMMSLLYSVRRRRTNAVP